MRIEGQSGPQVDVDDDDLSLKANGLPTPNSPIAASIIKSSINKITNEKLQNGFSSSSASAASFSPHSSGHTSNRDHLHHGPVKMPVKINNITTSQQLNDSLHYRSRPIACNNHACLGSMMAGQSKQSTSRSKEEILDQAVDFLEQYFIHSKTQRSDDLAQRLAEVANEIEKTNTYTLTTDELQFGAKTAWRNAPRCIGRIQWNKLEIQDARHVRTSKEMFEALCKHIEFATNNGNIRSMITVFPQRIPGRDDFRLWNSQLVSFAGYLQDDGSVIGDPIRVQFTRVCQRLGWKGKNGNFDVLPLVLSAPGEKPQFYEIPEELIIRVKLEHPRFEWFKDLNLQWYALPAVADMMFDCGGLQFTACPFNGWYMGTEIGARDLCDPQRYNITEKVAKMMGLDTSNATTLWKDQVLVEVNLAVLYSYRKNNITIVDHHTASDSFIKHMHNEHRSRGGCPADWVWIVPPVSGSITSVFHQEMLNYNLKPSYEYQEKAWKNYKWSNDDIKLKYKFSTIAKATLWTVMLMTKIMSKRIKATILFASETGKSETLAHKLGKLMNTSFFVKTYCMQDYNFENFTKETFVLIVTSTFGNGEAPDNGKEFWKQLYKLSHENIKLDHLKFGVFALGSTQYPTFCLFGKNVDKVLTDLGADKILSIGLGDEMKNQEQAFHNWAQECYKASCKTFDLVFEQNNLAIDGFQEDVYDPVNVRARELSNDASIDEHIIHNELARLNNKKIFPCKVISKVRLQGRNSERQTILVRLTPSNALARNMFNYEPGDHIGVFPCNPIEIVDALLGHVRRTGYDDPNSLVLQIEKLADGKWIPDIRLPPCTLRVALTHYLDITTPPTPRFLEYLIDMANDRWDSYRLKKLATDVENYEKWRLYNKPNMADVLNEFPSVHIDPEFLLTQLPLLQPRYYSISSSKKVTPEEVHLTMSLVCYKIHDGKGPKRYGVCTSYFDSFPENDVACFLRSAPSFRLPKDPFAPVIMIGAGSGIAPFRSFWQEREYHMQNGEKFGKMFLFFGCRQKSDNIYGSELLSLLEKGVLHEVFIAYSREPGNKKFELKSSFLCTLITHYVADVLPRTIKHLTCSSHGEYKVSIEPVVEKVRYVQDEVFKQRALIYWLLTNENAHIFVCGDSLMADGVRKSFVKVMENEGKMKESQAKLAVEELIDQSRYHEDVFGVIHH